MAAPYTQLAPTATPGKRYSFTAKTAYNKVIHDFIANVYAIHDMNAEIETVRDLIGNIYTVADFDAER